MSASGQKLPETWIYKSQLLSGSKISKDKATVYKSVSAFWYDKELGERKSLILGEGTPTHEFTHPFGSQNEAEQAAKAKLNEQGRSRHKATFNVIGNPLYKAENQVISIGLRSGIPKLWSCVKVDHKIEGGGYTCSIDGELPKAGG